MISIDNSGAVSYYLTDGQGSTRALTDENGIITDTYTYDAFGNVTAQTGDTYNPYLYNQEQYDANTGLYYLRARYMNPSTGRFISMDAYSGSIYDPMSLHKYLYASGSPTVYCDPTGYSDTTLAGQMTVCGILEVLCGMVVENMPQFGTTVATILVAVDIGYNNGVSDDKLKETLYSEPYNADDEIGEKTIDITLNTINSNVDDLKQNQKDHILNEKHNWGRLVQNPKDPKNWHKIAEIIATVLSEGKEERYKEVYIKTLEIGGEIVQVVYNYVEGAIKIGNAWVKP